MMPNDTAEGLQDGVYTQDTHGPFDGRSGVNMDCVSLAQGKQTQNMVHIGAGKEDGGDRRIAWRPGIGRQRRMRSKLDG
jgi:hypothetical protein